MTATAIAPYSNTGSPTSPGTTVSFLATLDIKGQTVPISTGDVTKGISNLKFSLANPVTLGSIDDFLDYLNENIGVPLDSTQLDGYINKIPDTPAVLATFKSTLLKIFHTALVIEVLNINVEAGTFTLGVAFPVDLKLTSFLTIDSIGVVVSRGEQGSPAGG